MKNLFLLLFVLSFKTIYSQTIKGKVMDIKGQPIAGALIQNISTKVLSESDIWGNFVIKKTGKKDSLYISMLSYESQKIAVPSLNNIEVALVEKSFGLSEIVVKKSLNATQIISKINVETNPVNSTQDLLRAVPGLFTGQHAGGGKAEQIFLRGFDIDHGTDIHISVDGLPVNMVSHAHGQGYADLHFVIPETVDNVSFAKGSYMADQGNFATAGSVDFKIKESIDQNTVKLEYGQFNHKRLLGMMDLIPKSTKKSAYVATEYLYADGPFVSPQRLGRFNIMSKASMYGRNNQKITFTGSYFQSSWNASGQVPNRAVEAGLINRFGAIDDTEGGATMRANLSAVYDRKINNNTYLHSIVYFSKYDFNLFSNFTFFANNPILGDQIKQKENRNLYGIETNIIRNTNYKELSLKHTFQIGLRVDVVKNSQLARTQNKEILIENLNLGNIQESNTFMQFTSEIAYKNWLIVPGIRVNHFDFRYHNLLSTDVAKLSKNTIIYSPKMNVIYQKSDKAQFYLKSGFGYHSNDARVIIDQASKYIVPRSFGADLGQIHKFNDKLVLNTALWYLALQQEFVYVGDEGIVESAGPTRRYGFDFSLREQLNRFVFIDADFTYAHARSIQDSPGENYIPLAPIYTFTFGASLAQYKGITLGLKTRVLGKRPANEDFSLTAKGYVVSDLNIAYTKGRYSLGLIIQNLCNTQWNETQFATTSRLQNEPIAVNEIHFTPGTPFNIRSVFKINF